MQIKHESYEEYKLEQTRVNKQKLNLVWVREDTIKKIKEICDKKNIGITRVLCHGTRNGAEQRYFKAHCRCFVLGTEISDTAMQFEDTIQWDFHDLKDEWMGMFDIIYSNSWDHAYDFERALKNWMQCLTDSGMVVLEYTKEHLVASNKADCFGVTKQELKDIIIRCGFVIDEFIDAQVISFHCPTTELVFIKNKLTNISQEPT